MIEEIASFARAILVFSGGEPLMRPDIFELAAFARDRRLRTALASNGTLIDGPLAESIKRAGFERVSVSLDGADSTTHDAMRQLPGSFERAMDGLRNLRGVGVSTQINCTIARHNAAQLGAVLRLAEHLGAEAVHYFLLVPVGCGEQIADEQLLDADAIETLLHEVFELSLRTELHVKATCAPHYYRIVRQESRKRGLHPPARNRRAPGAQSDGLTAITKGCLAGTAVCFVSHKGDVFPCGYLPVSAGNVVHTGLGRIWKDSELFARLRDPSCLSGKCGQCEFVNVCGGCRARAFYQYGDFLAEEPCCGYVPVRRSSGHAPSARP